LGLGKRAPAFITVNGLVIDGPGPAAGTNLHHNFSLNYSGTAMNDEGIEMIFKKIR
jgi:hypothetical protein